MTVNEPPERIVVPLAEDLPRELVSEYLADCRNNLLALDAALAQRDYDRMRVFGHQMKATGKPYGFPDLTTLGTAIEKAAVCKDTPELDRVVRQLEQYLSRVELAAG